MSSKFFHGFGEESSELRKQIGCMTGIFQMFDRHNLLGGRSFNGGQNHKLPSGNSFVNISSNTGGHSVSCSQLEKNLNKSLSENQRMSMESSRTSFSSSSCSSFSSVDCNKSTPQESISFNQTMNGLPNLKFSEIDAKTAHQSVDFQKVVKESSNNEPYGLSVQTSCKDEFKQSVLGYMDSPRPMQLSKSMDGSYVIGIDEMSRSPLDLNESFHVLMKLKDAQWSFSENMGPSFEAKEAPFSRTSRDGRRFSYDGRDMSSNFVDSRENFRLSSKLKELPRLSLDSKESSVRSCNSVVKDLYRSSINKERRFPPSNTQKEFESQKNAPSVVAKLMGLDSMPTSCSTLDKSMDTMEGYAVEKSYSSGFQRGNKILNSSLHSSKEGRLPKSSRTPMEHAPWKKKKESHVPQTTLTYEDNQLKKKPETVYSEIEKRLKEIEFRHTNKDLRALKQILDSMQVKGLLESKKNEEQHSPKPVCDNSNQVVTTRSAVSRRPPLPASTKGRNTNKTFESPIVIMKPAKSINIFDVTETSVISLHGLTRLPMIRTSEAMDKKKLSSSSKLSRDSTPRTSPKINGKTEENVQRSRVRTELGASKLQQSSREINGGLEKSSNSVSPRLQQRKLEVERRTSSSVSSSDSSKPQKLSTNKEPTESISPRNKLRRRPTRLQGNDDQLTTSIETRNLNHQGDEISQRSDVITSSETKLIRDDSSTKTSLISSDQGVQSLSTSLVLKQMYSPVAPEQPSPVSVLDDTFYQDDLPASEGKRSPNQSKGINFPSSDILCEPHHISSEINQKKLQSIGNLLRKLEELNPTSEGASTTDHIASLCRTSSRDHRYISEILLASSLLMKELSPAPVGLMPIQLHPSGHPINPDLFLVLEQTKSSKMSNFDTEKLHRKLLFDAVNEILIQILEGRRSISHRKLRGSVPSGQQLLKELCSEVDRIHADPLKADVFDDDSNIIDEKVLRKSAEWNDFRRGVPGIVLDIERLIFKDLIAEIVNGEAAVQMHRCGRRRRQLFVK
ncbi:Protein LONGIFOLIA 1 [Platanthera guangdongensis]|uniref:Protein LONGIFOLIA 1 n=1 Tax=Platanthera guangdongensis TaxID=2320717 RepID=A0ABR2N304_9ASPA